MGFRFELLIPIVAIVFTFSVPIVAIIVEHFTKKSKMRVMEKAIEMGMPLDGLSLGDKKGPRAPYRSGMVLVAIGIGVIILALVIGQMEREALNPLLGAGSIPVLTR